MLPKRFFSKWETSTLANMFFKNQAKAQNSVSRETEEVDFIMCYSTNNV